MNFILEAFSPADAVAIVQTGQRLRLIRPPYRQSNAIELPNSAIQDAVINHDFHVCGRQFENWETIIAFQNQQLADYRQKHGHPVAETLDSLEILEVAPLEVLQGFLDNVENQLIPQGQLEHANNFLFALLESGASKANPDLTIKAGKLLKQISQAEACKKNTALVFESQYNPFKSLVQKNKTEMANQAADYIKQQHGFFGFAAQAS